MYQPALCSRTGVCSQDSFGRSTPGKHPAHPLAMICDIMKSIQKSMYFCQRSYQINASLRHRQQKASITVLHSPLKLPQPTNYNSNLWCHLNFGMFFSHPMISVLQPSCAVSLHPVSFLSPPRGNVCLVFLKLFQKTFLFQVVPFSFRTRKLSDSIITFLF